MNELCERQSFQASSTASGTKVAFQKIAYNHFVKHLFPNDLLVTLKRRLKDILGTHKSHVVEANLELAIQTLKKLAKFEVIHVLKTWANSWAASYRFHEDKRLPCLLGCPTGQDCMKHYQSCPALRSLVLDALGHGDEWVHFDDLGIAAPSPDGLRAWSAVFYAYHAVKFKIVEFVSVSPLPNSESSVGQSAPSESTMFKIDAARSCGIFYRSFVAAACNVGLRCVAMNASLDAEIPHISETEPPSVSGDLDPAIAGDSAADSASSSHDNPVSLLV